MKLPTIKRKQPGFTLIELLIVVAIISILISIGLASYSRIQRSARDTQRRSDLRNVAGALEQFYSDNNQYPLSNAVLPPFRGKIIVFATNCTTTGAVQPLTWGTGIFRCGGKTYLSQLPSDPLPSQSYYYQVCDPVSRQTYALYMTLERDESDPPLPTGCIAPAGYNHWIVPQ